MTEEVTLNQKKTAQAGIINQFSSNFERIGREFQVISWESGK